MHEQRCPFERVILSIEFSCTESQKYFYAQKEGISCTNPPARMNCSLLIEHLKKNSKFVLRDVFSRTDKLTHGQEMKIKNGGLHGLQAVTRSENDIHALLTSAIEQFGALEKLPWDKIVPSVQAYKIRKSGSPR